MSKSPCIKACTFDREKDLCTGCYRRLSEIANWSLKSSSEKDKIIESAKKLKMELENLERTRSCFKQKD